mmetsp:Transcript_45880/g.76461  ORF Transcript_45880/g.76461 Transcript_45880/m.76461 type:complete len:81 (-) Transcript_45880:368-610(-)
MKEREARTHARIQTGIATAGRQRCACAEIQTATATVEPLDAPAKTPMDTVIVGGRSSVGTTTCILSPVFLSPSHENKKKK